MNDGPSSPFHRSLPSALLAVLTGVLGAALGVWWGSLHSVGPVRGSAGADRARSDPGREGSARDADPLRVGRSAQPLPNETSWGGAAWESGEIDPEGDSAPAIERSVRVEDSSPAEDHTPQEWRELLEEAEDRVRRAEAEVSRWSSQATSLERRRSEVLADFEAAEVPAAEAWRDFFVWMGDPRSAVEDVGAALPLIEEIWLQSGMARAEFTESERGAGERVRVWSRRDRVDGQGQEGRVEYSLEANVGSSLGVDQESHAHLVYVEHLVVDLGTREASFVVRLSLFEDRDFCFQFEALLDGRIEAGACISFLTQRFPEDWEELVSVEARPGGVAVTGDPSKDESLRLLRDQQEPKFRAHLDWLTRHFPSVRR